MQCNILYMIQSNDVTVLRNNLNLKSIYKWFFNFMHFNFPGIIIFLFVFENHNFEKVLVFYFCPRCRFSSFCGTLTLPSDKQFSVCEIFILQKSENCKSGANFTE